MAAVYAENIRLAAPGQPVDSGMVLDISPLIELTQESSRLRSELSYQLRSFHYLDDSDFDTSYHTAEASSMWFAVPEWLNISAEAGYEQRIVDPRQAATNDRLFSTGNLTDAASAAISPQLLHDFGNLRLDAYYSYGLVKYQDDVDDFDGSVDATVLDDSDNQTAHVIFGTTPVDGWQRLAWNIGYNWERSEYDVSLPYEYARASLGTGIGLSPGITMLLEGGMESDLIEDTTKGGLDEEYYRGGFRWSPDTRTTVEALVGHRFFGTTYAGRITTRARRLDLSLGYSEEPTTEGRQVLRRNTAPGVPTIPQPGIDITRTTSEPFIAKLLDGSVRMAGRLTSLYGRISAIEREYLNTGLTEDVMGWAAGVERRLGPRMSAELGFGQTRTEYRDGAEGTDNEMMLRLDRQLSSTFLIATQARYLSRSGTGLDDYHAWAVSLELRKSFGGDVNPPPRQAP